MTAVVSSTKQSKTRIGSPNNCGSTIDSRIFAHFHHADAPCNIDGYRLLSKSSTGGPLTQTCHQAPRGPGKHTSMAYSGNPKTFLKRLSRCNTQENPHSALPDVLKEALLHVLSSDPIELAKHRLQVVLAIKRRSEELAEEERALKQNMETSVTNVLSSKRFLLWKSLMKETGYRDSAIFDLVCNGIPLHGEHDIPEGAAPDWKPAISTADEILETGVWRRKAIQGGSPNLDLQQQQDLHDASMAEVDKGHLHGPLSEQQISEAFGDESWIFSPRFAVYQGEEKKVRPIDDCKRSGLNTSYTVNFRLELLDVDALACLIAATNDALAKGAFECELSDGGLIGCAIHPKVASDEWQGRTLDLSRAYKQLPIDEKSRRLSVVGYQHDNVWKFLFKPCVLI